MTKPLPPRTILASSTSLAVAACSMALTATHELQLLPAGAFSARDGRPADAPGWKLDAALAQVLIAAAESRATPYVIDYEHQTLLAKENGKPAPAAGWFTKMEWRDGVGLFAVDVEWTANAQGMIAAKEYKFVSPVIGYDKKTGAVTSLYMAAITNNPAIDGMDEVLLAAASLRFALPPHPTPLTQEIQMDELLEKLRWMLNLPITATAAEIQVELQKLIDQIKTENPEATAAASFHVGALFNELRNTIVRASLTSTVPDPEKFVPVATMLALQGQVAQLTGQLNGDKVDVVVKAALDAGKLVPAQEAWARGLGAKNFEALTSYLDSAPPIAVLTGMQTGGLNPAGKPAATALTANQAALCVAMGVTEDAFRATLQAEQQS
jgi:phage I-like protein